MNNEIERKFKVISRDWANLEPIPIEIKQGYFPTSDQVAIRIRQRKMVRPGITTSVLTLKFPKDETGGSPEFEYPTPCSDGKALMEACETIGGGVIHKTRWVVNFGGKVWEIDEFHSPHNGLIIAEVELESIDEKIVIPPWVGEEVTNDRRYTNAYLAFNPNEQFP